MQGDTKILKLWLSLVNLYRDIPYTGKLKLSTIVDKSTCTPSGLEIIKYVKPFRLLFIGRKHVNFSKPNGPFQLLTSGPQTNAKEHEFNSMPEVALRSMHLITRKSFRLIFDALSNCLGRLNGSMTFAILSRIIRSSELYNYEPIHHHLGKLSAKIESAGKIRIFAMVDPWTQWALKPLHKFIFKVLRKVPMDGTFDQLKPLKRVPFGKVPIYSFDLSAATDRLPIIIQSELLSEIFGKEFAQSWVTLLTSRRYKTPMLIDGIYYAGKDKYPKSVKYSTGQPMGALSSWGMLALTHHFIIQSCAWKVGVTKLTKLFTAYAVLGDDVVIWNKPVADEYLRILKQLGVTVGLAKSIISEKGLGLEFAKKTIIKGIDVSPIPFKELSAAHRSFANMRTFMTKYNMSLLKVLRILGYGYKVDPTKVSTKVVNVIDLALSIPREYSDIVKLFKLRWWAKVELAAGSGLLPPDLLNAGFPFKKAMMDIVAKEYSSLGSDLEIALNKLREHRYTVLKTRNLKEMLIYGLNYFRIGEIIIDLVETKETLDKHYNNLEYYINLFADSEYSYPDIVYTEFQLGIPKEVQEGIDYMFTARRTLDSYQIKMVINPSRSMSVSPSFLEEKRTLQMWNHWASHLHRYNNLVIRLDDNLSMKFKTSKYDIYKNFKNS
uniref:RNA-dependent RNA polymerase n=1 Tax=Tianjin Mitov tick virus 1 TaxID=2972192 RepID=A0A9E8A9C5_9VIRU|nr:MAG: RNA-dependent RNA polymerase [Tianjin Mitov tick virus 1]